jgi:hypothetical protein
LEVWEPEEQEANPQDKQGTAAGDKNQGDRLLILAMPVLCIPRRAPWPSVDLAAFHHVLMQIVWH